MTNTAPEPDPGRTLDMAALKGLAHPLRVAILDRLSTYGPATASGLGETLGESSGATSYHLRQLAKHGFVQELEGRGSGRERWWERVPGGISLPNQSTRRRDATEAASNLVASEWERRRAMLLDDFVRRGDDVLGPEWTDGAAVTTVNVRLTADQLADVSRQLCAELDRIIAPYRGRSPVGSRPAQVHLNVFPIADGSVTTPEEADS